MFSKAQRVVWYMRGSFQRMVLVKARKNMVVIGHVKICNGLPQEPEREFLAPGTVQWEMD